MAFGLPAALLAGTVWGLFSAAEMSIDPAFGWTVLSALTFTMFLWVEERLRPAAAEAGRQLGVGPAAGLAWDLGLVGGGSFLVVDVLGAPMVPAVTTAVVLGGGYAWLMERVFCGGLVEGIAGFLSPLRRMPLPYTDHSMGEALAARGEIEAAMDYYRRSMEGDPADPLPYLRLADLLVAELDRPDEAVRLLRNALRHSRLDDAGRAYVLRRLRDVRSGSRGRSGP